MASEYYGVNRGQQHKDVVVATSSPTKDIELKIDLTKNLTKAEVIMLLELLEDKITTGIWPPA